MKDVSATYLADEIAEERTIAECYHIWSDNLGEDDHQFYTSDNADITAMCPELEIGSKLHTAVPIERGVVEWAADLEITTMKIKVANITEPTVQFIANNPVELFWVSVYRVHKAHPDETPSIIFLGQIQTVRFSGTAAEVTVAGFENFLKRQIPVYRYQKICNNSLFDEKCGLDRSNFDQDVTVSDIDDTNLVIEATGMSTPYPNYYRYGYAEFTVPGTSITRRAMIASNSGEEFTLSYRLYGLEVGNTVTIYPGCNKQTNSCTLKFGNIDNFFGMPHLSYKNPTLL